MCDHDRDRRVPEGVLRGLEDLAEGNTASKEDLDQALSFTGVDDDEDRVCWNCNGLGWVTTRLRRVATSTDCHVCDGTGINPHYDDDEPEDEDEDDLLGLEDGSSSKIWGTLELNPWRDDVAPKNPLCPVCEEEIHPVSNDAERRFVCGCEIVWNFRFEPEDGDSP